MLSTMRNAMLRSARPSMIRPMPLLRRSMFIQTSSTPNEDALKFLPSHQILGENAATVEFVNGRQAYNSPLARKLFAVDGVRSVMFGPDFITVEKTTDSPWMVLKPEIFSILTEHLSSGAPVLTEDAQAAADTAPNEEDSEVVSMIKELIDTRIRPAIQEDGGDLLYRGFTEDGIVKLKLQGACRSCDSSSVTLKNGIESMLMHYVEEVTGVEQVLDPEEEVALKEFQKLEQKLDEKNKHQEEKEEAAPSL
jgi:Fe-S cluster biogenesis protein NfuA